MRVTFLGTNGWFDTNTGNSPCVLIETSNNYIVLDLGTGVYKLDKYIKSKKPITIFVSHTHLEHVHGVHILNKFKFNRTVKIYGPPGTKKIMRFLISSKFTRDLKDLPYKVELYDLKSGKHKLPFTVTCKPLIHPRICFGYRFELDGKIIAYCTDTGLCKNAIELGKNADILITECTKLNEKQRTAWPHLDPKLAAKMAKEAKAKKLYLLHFQADIYTSMKMRKQAEKTARKIFPNTFATKDLMQIAV